jgi:hypothetical protein
MLRTAGAKLGPPTARLGPPTVPSEYGELGEARLGPPTVPSEYGEVRRWRGWGHPQFPLRGDIGATHGDIGATHSSLEEGKRGHD